MLLFQNEVADINLDATNNSLTISWKEIVFKQDYEEVWKHAWNLASPYDITDFVSDETRLLSVAGDGMDWVMKKWEPLCAKRLGLTRKIAFVLSPGFDERLQTQNLIQQVGSLTNEFIFQQFTDMYQAKGWLFAEEATLTV
ncbi:hypothetical protein [uncultured Microscilla sp.]|uniref:hypothetical protein n=1 Tax=uncultured Microscilla sp. TaxID=432653 RepID=UPI002624B4F1|nr:hypothetical protein [uncultured Microscilla sp.]